jgi:acetylornithine deacetylase/succinyl-diaminopimelate desuccinylase-like protein
MEGLPKFESRESAIDKLIKNLAEKEGMSLDEILSDIITFTEISKEDEDAKAYFEELAERIGISFDEMMAYALKKAEELY